MFDKGTFVIYRPRKPLFQAYPVKCDISGLYSVLNGGHGENRTRDNAFAERRITTFLRGHIYSIKPLLPKVYKIDSLYHSIIL